MSGAWSMRGDKKRVQILILEMWREYSNTEILASFRDDIKRNIKEEWCEYSSEDFIEWRLFVKTVIYIEGKACELMYFSPHLH